MEQKNPETNCQIELVNEALKEISKEQINLSENLLKKIVVITNKLDKLQEYNKIDDMTNQVFEIRMSNIEDLLLKINSKL